MAAKGSCFNSHKNQWWDWLDFWICLMNNGKGIEIFKKGSDVPHFFKNDHFLRWIKLEKGEI